MSLPKPGGITTTASMAESKFRCHGCGEHAPVLRPFDRKLLCDNCHPQGPDGIIRVVKDADE